METERLLIRKIENGNCRIQEYIHVHAVMLKNDSRVWQKRLCPCVSWLKKGACITYFDGTAEPMKRKAGDVVYHPAGRSKYSEFLGDSMEIVAATFDTGGPEDDLFSYLEIPCMLPEPAAAELRSCLRATGKLKVQPWQASTLADAAAFRELSARMLRILISVSSIRKEAKSDVPEKLRLVHAHLRKHFREPQPISKLAEMACLSRPRFHCKFLECFGTPPGKFLLQLRFREAEKLLLLTDLSVSEIAFRTGWNDPLFFSRSFSAYYGMPPAAFRKKPGAF